MFWRLSCCCLDKYLHLETTSHKSVHHIWKDGWFLFCIHPDCDRIPSTTPGEEPPRDAKDFGSPRSHSTHLETSNRPKKIVTYMEHHTVPSYMSVKVTRRTLRMPRFTRTTHAQPSLSNFPWRDSDFGEQTRSRRTT